MMAHWKWLRMVMRFVCPGSAAGLSEPRGLQEPRAPRRYADGGRLPELRDARQAQQEPERAAHAPTE